MKISIAQLQFFAIPITSVVERLGTNMLVAVAFVLSISSPFAQNLSSVSTIGPDSEVGAPFLQSFDATEYQGSTHNWDIVQDSFGLIYIANGRGLLIYNGETFDLLRMPNGSSVRCLAVDAQNRIYCGGTGYFGYLAHNDRGFVTLVNLADSIARPNAEQFSTVENIYCSADGVYFRSPERLFRWTDGNFKFWDAEEHRFLSTFLVNGILYVNRKNLGLQVLEGEDTFRSLGDEPLLAGDKITSVLPLHNDLLIGTDKDLFIWNNKKELLKFDSPAQDFVHNARLFKASQLSDGTYVLCTLNSGLVIIDQEGNIILHIDTRHGLPSSSIYQVYQAPNGKLWIATNNGLALMEYPSEFSTFRIGNKTPPISDIVRFKGDLLIGTFNGLYYLDSSGTPPAQLRPFLNIKDRIWDLLVVGDHLFIGFEDGLYLLRQDKRLEKINADAISEMWQSKVDSNRIFVAARKGLSSLYWSDAGWIKEPWDIALGEGAYHINEQEDGTLWLDVNKSWIYRVTFPSVKDAAKLRQASLHKLDTSAGLPGVNGYIMMHDDRIFYVNNRDLNMLYFDPISDRFRSLTNEEAPFSELGKQLVIGHDDDTQNKWLVEFKNGRITQTFLAIVNEGNDIVQELGEDRISDLIGRCMYYDDGVIWHGGSDILVRNDLEKKSNQEPFNTTIHKIYYQDDSLISSGPYRSAEYRFPFSNNRFRFTYGNTSFIANQKEEYQYLLEGYMDDWSSWTSESRRDFTNLKEGAYRFKVRSQTMGGQVGRQDVIEFEILPPWHRSWWAYIIYTLLGILGTGGIVKWRLRQLQKEKIALENLVHLNTAELEVRNEQLMEQKLKLSKQTIALQEMDQFKSRLFANISHEFRTPLTLIKGPLERLKKSPEGKLSEEHIHMMDRNANRLLRLVNQILDLSKLDASDLPLNPAEGNVFKSIRVAASTFSSHAADHNIDYQIMVPATQLWAAFDRDKLEKVIYNLLSNAFKFTGDGGTIKLQASYYQGALRLEVSDTGKGIASGDLPKIFDRFYQIDQSDSRSEEGSGIGLALVKELIELMQGSIQVESTLDHGSTFFVDLPMEPLNFLTGRITPSPVVLKDSPLPKIPKMDKHPLTESIDLSKVLVIEDNPDMRAYIVEHLQGKYRVLEARNAQEGLKTALVKLPDLIVTDLMMPKMNGLEFCEIVKTDLRISHIPVVILTAKAGIENKLVGLESGADVYLTKPFHGEELSVQINRLIESRSRLRSLFAQQARVDPKDLELPRLDQQFIEKVLEILESRYDDADFDVPKMHQLLAMSRTQLHRKIKALTGQAPGEFIRHFRLKRAAQILIRGENVAQTAYAVGFNNLSYFARSFRALHGVSPKEYANQYREG